jgi:hypothetical protein
MNRCQARRRFWASRNVVPPAQRRCAHCAGRRTGTTDARARGWLPNEQLPVGSPTNPAVLECDHDAQCVDVWPELFPKRAQPRIESNTFKVRDTQILVGAMLCSTRVTNGFTRSNGPLSRPASDRQRTKPTTGTLGVSKMTTAADKSPPPA